MRINKTLGLTPEDAERNEQVISKRYGDAMRAVMRTRAGREMFVFLLDRLNYFSDIKTEEEAAVRRAGIQLLEDVRKETGFFLDYGFTR
ncbi:MAG: hypothetical protein Ta2B_09240 [Termitinemataceae bacterium]|nr:MAG: hypothetical protein Ta2B_09240 [Termitinemataceae bacterium]